MSKRIRKQVYDLARGEGYEIDIASTYNKNEWEGIAIWVEELLRGRPEEDLYVAWPHGRVIQLEDHPFIFDVGRVIRVGDVDPVTYGGGFVYRFNDNDTVLEYTYGFEMADYEGYTEHLYRIGVNHDEVTDYLDNLGVLDGFDSFASSLDLPYDDYLTYEGDNMSTLAGRVRIVEDLIQYYGPVELDPYPEIMTEDELSARWFPEVLEDDEE